MLIAEYTETGDEHALQQAISLLERLLEAAEEGDRMGSVIEILIVLSLAREALAHQAGGDMPNTLTPLQRALFLAEPERYGRIFLDEGPLLAQLLSAAAAQGIMPHYTRRLLNEFPIPHSPKSEMIDPLSDRELEVLQLIAQGLTNQQIADRLYLSLNTVKVHNRNIFSKLDAHHRAQAVARATELRILPSS